MFQSDRSVTHDTLLGGALGLYQPSRGYRVSVDTLLLAAFTASRPCEGQLVDLGAGVGALGLAALALGTGRRAVLVEREPELADLAQRNLAASGAVGHVEVRDLETAGLCPSLVRAAHVVVCNPPFFELGSGRLGGEAVTARHGPVLPFLKAAAAALVDKKARAMFAYPAASLQSFLAQAGACGLHAKRIRCVHPRSGEAARLVLLELCRGNPGGLTVLAPLIEWSRDGERDAEVARLLDPA